MRDPLHLCSTAAVRCLASVTLLALVLLAVNTSSRHSLLVAGSAVTLVCFLIQQATSACRTSASCLAELVAAISGALWTWLLCLLLTLASGRGLLESPSDDEFLCSSRMGDASLWIVLVLAASSLCVTMPTRCFVALGQVISAQHVVAHLLSPGCRQTSMSMFGLNPLWTPALQLHVTALIMARAYHFLECDRRVSAAVTCFMQGPLKQPNLIRSFSSDGVSDVKTTFEQLLNTFAQEKLKFENFLEELDLLASGSSHALSQVLAALVDSTVDFVEVLKHSAPGPGDQNQTIDANERIFSWMAAGTSEQLKVMRTDSSALPHAEGGHQGANDASASDAEAQESQACAESSRSDLSVESFGGTLSLSSVSGIEHGLTVEDRYSILQWNFNAIKIEAKYGRVLQIVGTELLSKYRSCLPLPQDAVAALLDIFAQQYRDLPYHSSAHAADMANSFQFMLLSSGLVEMGRIPGRTCVAAILAGLGHDIGHSGFNNMFLINSRQELAVRYNDRSVLENFHAATVVSILMEPLAPLEQSIFSILEVPKSSKLRHLIISLILSTDISKLLTDLSALRVKLSAGAGSFNPLPDSPDLELALTWLFRAADIGHAGKPFHLHEDWSKRCVCEFHAQGDKERELGLPISPLCARDNFDFKKSQVGFLQFLCVPTFTEIANLESMVMSKSEHREDKVDSEHMKIAPRKRRSSFSGPIDDALAAASASRTRQRRASDTNVPTLLGKRGGELAGSRALLALDLGTRKVCPDDIEIAAAAEKRVERRGIIAQKVLALCQQNLRTWTSMIEEETGGPVPS
eukprot:TRINITY_DN28461_c1_g2_i1.p1 TRINITY_DN28461_c1_g2~~TRINITY_DN28461_c1_g2_i1.p1  ORF type:complete len:804 (-),score=145.49 TRINITY_DN28461_c1_g2_i1:114-2525(-)